SRRLVTGGICSTMLLTALVGTGANAAPAQAEPAPVPQLEHLDRGLVAATTDDGVYLSWRLLAGEVTGADADRQHGPEFVVSRDVEPIACVTDSSCLLDPNGTETSTYTVSTAVDGRSVSTSDEVMPWAQGHYDLPLNRPEGGVTPAGESYTYS